MPAGLILAIVAAACYEIGYAVQALEARRVDRADHVQVSLLGRLLRRPRWVIGMALSLLGAAAQVAALTLAPITVVAPTLAVGLVGLLFLSHHFLREAPTRRDLAGVVTVVVGVTGVALAAPAYVGRSHDRTALATVLGLLTVFALLPYALRRRGVTPRLAVAGAAAGDAVAVLAMKLAADAIHSGMMLLTVGWAALAAAAGLLALAAEMSALQRLPATRVAPVVVAASVLIPVLTAPFLFGERWGATPLGGVVLGTSVAVVAAGAVVLAMSPRVGGVMFDAGVAEALEHDGRR